jgi:hypothetical protein
LEERGMRPSFSFWPFHTRERRIAMRTKMILSLLVALVVVVAAIAPVYAQGPTRTTEDLQLLAQIGMQIGQSMRDLTNYSFQQRTAVQIDGELKNTTLVQVAFGPDNSPITTTISSEPPEDLPRGPLRRAIAENKLQEMKGMIGQVVQLSNSYLMLNQEKLAQIGQVGQVWMTPGGSTIRVVASGVQQPGDQVTITCDGETKRQLKTEVQTRVFDGPMTVFALYQKSFTGLNYNAETVVNVPEKGLQITINTFNYIRQR